MLQKRNDFALVETLHKGPSHVRELANTLKFVPSTVLRMLLVLQQESVVDFKREGKNTTYFIKNTPEAKIYSLMTEHYKLLKLIQEPALKQLTRELQAKTNGELVILFGSVAKGTATPSSDIDLYIETTDETTKAAVRAISSKISLKTGTFDTTTPLAKEIIKNHIIIQNTERFYHLTT